MKNLFQQLNTALFVVLVILGSFGSNGCASTTPSKVFLPNKSDHLFPYFRKGIPIGALSTDSLFFLLSLQPDELITESKYIRLWVLAQNRADSPILLEPKKMFKLERKKLDSVGDNYEDIEPESPTKILADIENQKAVELISSAIGGVLKDIEAKPTTMKSSSGDVVAIDDVDSKRAESRKETILSMNNTSNWYNVYSRSVHTGILRRETVFSGQSVNGYVYFPFPRYTNPEKFSFTLTVSLSSGVERIVFTPEEGE